MTNLFRHCCTSCGRTFEGKKDWDVKYARDEHQKYCQLRTFHKIMGALSLPLALIILPLIIGGMILYFCLAPIGYPFTYALSMMLDSEPITWRAFRDMAYGKDEVRSYKLKKEVKDGN